MENVDVQLVSGMVVMDLDVVKVEGIELANVDVVALVMEVIDHGDWKWNLDL